MKVSQCQTRQLKEEKERVEQPMCKRGVQHQQTEDQCHAKTTPQFEILRA